MRADLSLRAISRRNFFVCAIARYRSPLLQRCTFRCVRIAAELRSLSAIWIENGMSKRHDGMINRIEIGLSKIFDFHSVISEPRVRIIGWNCARRCNFPRIRITLKFYLYFQYNAKMCQWISPRWYNYLDVTIIHRCEWNPLHFQSRVPIKFLSSLLSNFYIHYDALAPAI